MTSIYRKIKWAVCLISMLPIVSCTAAGDETEKEHEQPSSGSVTLSVSDSQATAETKALYANLWEVQQKGFMFGHHDDLFYGRYWYNKSGNSDTKDVCGDYPAVFSCDFAEIMDDRYETAKEANDIRKRCILEARRRGEVITACCHLNNPLTGGDSWDNSSHMVAAEILTDGSATQLKFKSWLDRLVTFALSLKDDNGRFIPIIFRPFHEHTQTWSWWGKSCTTEAEFISLWRFTVDYLQHAGVHHFIYAVSPQMDSRKTMDDFLFRWPGDDYVDFIGMDCYHGLNPEVFSHNLKMLSDLSAIKQKPCGVTETGVESFTDKDYWTKQILTPATGRKVSMIVMWRNKFVNGNEADKHYYSVYGGHPSASDFVKFYNSELTLFSKDLNDMYSLPTHITVN